MPESKEVTPSAGEGEGVSEVETGGEAERQQQHGGFGMSVLSGEIQEYDPKGDELCPFE
jgi:hypothetical protein